ncbi:MAG: hypothetical protein NT049_13435, partial [Planctomycetota bacterium]|nr:hypothetical protein [Planctomycetota bacterium]
RRDRMRLQADDKQVLSSRDTTKAVELAAKLLESAKAAEGQPELMSLLCTRACELGAMDPKGYETAQAAADLVASKAPDAAGPCQEALAAIRQRQYDAARGDAKTQAGEALVDALLALAATRTRTGKVEDAGKPLYKALAVAKAINSSKIETVDALLKAHADRQKNVALLAQLKKQVEADPANAKARDPLVTLLVVGFDNPAEAAKYLVDACDSALKKFVPAAARPVADAPEMACLELADWYMQLAATAGPASKLAMYVRAVQYGERFLELHTAKDLDRTRVELAVKKAGDEITRLGGAASDKGHWMDVLKLVDPARDTIRGQWEQTKAGLLTDAGSPHAVIGVPIEPSGNYELEVKFVRLAGSADVGVSFPAGPNHAVLCLAWRGGTTSGLSGINETLVNPSGLSNNHVYTVVLRVMTAEDKAQITATLDGKPLVKWEGPQKALSVPFFVALRNPKCVGLSAYKSRVLFQSVRLKMLSGKAVPTRPMGAAKSDTKPTEK